MKSKINRIESHAAMRYTDYKLHRYYSDINVWNEGISISIRGKTSQMASFQRVNSDGEGYKVEYTSVPLEKVANKEMDYHKS